MSADPRDAQRRAEAEQRRAAYARRHVGYEIAQDPSSPARFARWSLIACAAVGVLMIAVELWHLSVLGDVPEESYATSGRLDDSDFRVGLAYLAQLAVFVATVVAFIVWLHRVYSNLRPLGAYELRFGTGWAIGGWFVPILNLWRPKQIVNDVWRASDPERPVWFPRREFEDAPVPGILLVWWIVLLVQGSVERGATRAYEDASTVGAERSATILALCASVLWIVAALLAIVVVDRLTARQRERAATRERTVDPALAQPQPVVP